MVAGARAVDQRGAGGQRGRRGAGVDRERGGEQVVEAGGRRGLGDGQRGAAAAGVGVVQQVIV